MLHRRTWFEPDLKSCLADATAIVGFFRVQEEDFVPRPDVFGYVSPNQQRSARGPIYPVGGIVIRRRMIRFRQPFRPRRQMAAESGIAERSQNCWLPPKGRVDLSVGIQYPWHNYTDARRPKPGQ